MERLKGQTGNMDRSTALDSLDLESSRFLVAASYNAAALSTPLPTCPGWDVAQLVKHLGLIYSQVALVVSGRRTKLPTAVNCLRSLTATRGLAGSPNNERPCLLRRGQ